MIDSLDEKRVKKVAQVLGIEDFVVEKALGVPLEEYPATTVEEARDAFILCVKARDKAAALEKWIKLSMKEVEKADTVEKAKNAYEKAPKDTSAEIPALEKWNGFSMKEVEKADTVDDIIDTYHGAPEDSEAQIAALEKWIKLSMKEVEKADTVEKAKKAYDRALEDSEAQIAALKKWNGFSMKEVEKADTVEKISAACRRAPEDSEAQIAALEKWNGFCTIVEEFKDFYFTIRDYEGYLFIKEGVIKKVYELV